MKSLLIALSTLIAVSIALAQGGDVGDSPVPNTECGSAKVAIWPFPGGAVAGVSTDPFDSVAEALENASGIVCETCAGSVQCERELSRTDVLAAGIFVDNLNGTYTFIGFIVAPGRALIECKPC